jgi:hypothetical protein
MNAGLPILVDISMTFAAKPIAFCEIDQIPIKEPKFISIFCIMTIETPPHRLGVMKLDIVMFFFQFSLLSIYLHRGMAIATREHSLCHGRRGIFINDCERRKNNKKDQKQGSTCCER